MPIQIGSKVIGGQFLTINFYHQIKGHLIQIHSKTTIKTCQWKMRGLYNLDLWCHSLLHQTNSGEGRSTGNFFSHWLILRREDYRDKGHLKSRRSNLILRLNTGLKVSFLCPIFCSLLHYHFYPFINLCRHGFMKSWDCWNFLEMLPVIELNIVIQDESIRFLRMLGAGCLPSLILWFSGCVLGGDYNTWHYTPTPTVSS